MPDNRFFCDHSLQKDTTVVLAGEEFIHMKKVMRAKINDTVELINGRNRLAHARICHFTSSSAELFIEKNEKKSPSSQSIILHQPLIHPGRLDWVIEKATELGMKKICLFRCRHSLHITPNATRQRRMKALTIAAIKQCGRWDLPELIFYDQLLDYSSLEGKVFYGDTSKDTPYLLPQLTKNNSSSYHLFIGPEKGFDKKEILFLKNLEATGVRLHPNILRSETAAIAFMSIVSNYFSSK